MVVVTMFYQYGPGQVPVPPVIPPGQEHDCNEWIYSCNISVRTLHALALVLGSSSLTTAPQGKHQRPAWAAAEDV